MRKTKQFKLTDINKFKICFLHWSKKYETSIILDSNHYSKINQSNFAFHSYEFLAGIETNKIITPNNQSFSSLKEILNKNNDWWFGYLAYDLKNELEELSSDNYNGLAFPPLYFFCPKLVFYIKNNILTIEYYQEDYSDIEIYNTYQAITEFQFEESNAQFKISTTGRFTKQEYIETVHNIKKQIQSGNIYEINFCQEFYAENTIIDPYITFQKLNKNSPTPFACFLKINKNFLLSASPERYLKKINSKIVSQPIKGTVKRGITSREDIKNINKLKNSEKEQAENIMIVDLVRNDLSKIAKKASVQVNELCGIYSYRQVHQMISTISAELQDKINPVDIIKATFPMGSMTGAPKLRAMKLIEKYERTKRGLFSGAVGYFSPDLNFDFNVVIRSILYNEKTKYLSYSVGGAITSLSDAEEEYNECILKAQAINQVLNNEN
ncbi:MAG: anthranilate synthase component I family protein [Chlorobi bacterium]|nr:anthranilate synthase component I family protein [Chlorobiota bacterium]